MDIPITKSMRTALQKLEKVDGRTTKFGYVQNQPFNLNANTVMGLILRGLLIPDGEMQWNDHPVTLYRASNPMRTVFQTIADLLRLVVNSIKTDRSLGDTFELVVTQRPDLDYTDCIVDLRDYRVRIIAEGQGNSSCWEFLGKSSMCPLCPSWDTRYPIQDDFYGEPCKLNGIPCCETCYTVYWATHDTDGNPLGPSPFISSDESAAYSVPVATDDTGVEEPLAIEDTVKVRPGCVGAGCVGTITAFLKYDIVVKFEDTFWIYAPGMLDFISHSAKHLWHALRRLMHEKNYTFYCGYHPGLRDFAICGHPDGWPSVWSGDRDGLERAIGWVKQAPPGVE